MARFRQDDMPRVAGLEQRDRPDHGAAWMNNESLHESPYAIDSLPLATLLRYRCDCTVILQGSPSMDFRSRLQRPRAYNDPGHAHELTFSCFRKYRFLCKERTCEWLADAIEAAREKLQFNLWAFVFMP